ncbi:MAG: DUF302 domain-containing protein [Bacillota bacterium]|nr:DUF302 domain-containing protein [Bacillota bacterium]MDW7678689.1 DUF302 domain-containing protein [Bacillota bacterium]
MSSKYTYAAKTDKSVSEAVKAVQKSLQEQGFGTLWEFNVPAKLHEKGVDYEREAVILEVCNPKRAKSALETNLQAIYFLPCKVVVFDEDGRTTIGMMLPSIMMEALQDPNLKAFAHEVEEALRQAIDLAVTTAVSDDA